MGNKKIEITLQKRSVKIKKKKTHGETLKYINH